MKSFGMYFKRALFLTLALFVICGVLYPFALTGLGQLFFNKQANGNMIEVNGKSIGSELVGQAFERDEYFHGRVSSVHYNTY